MNLYHTLTQPESVQTLTASARQLREQHAGFAAWAAGGGVICHSDKTQVQVAALAEELLAAGHIADVGECYQALSALDCLTNQAMWLVVHMTYAKNVFLDGRDMQPDDFKRDPQGHTGGSLNMVPAYAGMLALNRLTGQPRDWLMGQGHCVAAVDALQLLTGTALSERRQQYPLNDDGLSRFTRDFYNYRVRPDGKPLSPLGSHVNVHTAGARIEGGYLGFAGLQYVHQPLPGERLVAFLSDGAFEEQRGSDWAARWWRAEDTGLVSPVMIANGRRIDQRTTVAQQGGTEWFVEHLRHQGFAPFVIDGRDPAAFVCAIFAMEQELQRLGAAVQCGDSRYPVALPYCIAETIKGYGFPGAGTNAAHGLPLGSNPRRDAEALRFFHKGAKALWQDEQQWRAAVAELKQPKTPAAPVAVTVNRHDPHWHKDNISPMAALDGYFVDLIEVNPQLRVRVGNPDELSSNRMNQTLDHLKHRVTDPEDGVAEAVDGAVITALNEEAVVSACLANQAGLNMVVSYEAFSTKMLGALRQSIIFSRHQKEANDPASWLGIPVISTSHLWENGKNEQSHQDPSLAEALLGEMSDMARVVFPADGNSAMACLKACYGDLGTVWNLVVPKSVVPTVLDGKQAAALVRDGAICVRGHCGADLQLVACGAFQLQQALKASDRLQQRGVAHSLIYLLEPGRFRIARDAHEAEIMADASVLESLFPARVQGRVLLTHTRPEVLLGHARLLDLGPARTVALGYVNQGGTLDTEALLFANHCTWADALAALARLAGQPPQQWLSEEEWAAIQGEGDPYQVIKHPYPDGL
ncbi:xylulose 5-phosphate 3-epimerase [Venatoribacter cucullus]|uniref:Xylulose 5-phosphate 3-epimerase n=1 Tax=Venatoribacter cucullus TaxID=2661630 RepID=A0A9X7YP15_9GAMM|nr:xylulose 5-phosphate 3-epimerase [Venatoribacter cucullus]QQD23577.1 xylulose 5-phosphate 3-epimerase [Venatoribacter cucullus]